MELEVDKREQLAKNIAKVAGIVSIVFSIFASISLVSENSTSSISELSAIEDQLSSNTSQNSFGDTSWVPSGYTAWADDSNIAYKWGTKNNCQNYGCISAEFISQNGCPNGLYAAINWLDNSDVVVSYSNDSIPSLRSMQTAKLRFDDFEEIGKSGQMSTVICS